MFSKGQANHQDGFEENKEYQVKKTNKSVYKLSERFKQKKGDNSDEEMENQNYITNVEKRSTSMNKIRSWSTEASESIKKKQKYAKRMEIDEEDQIGSKTSSSASEDDSKEIGSQEDMDEVTPQIDEEDQIRSKNSSSESEDDDLQFVYEDAFTKNDSKISAPLA